MFTKFTLLRKTILLSGLAACTLLTSCDDNDDSPEPQPTYTTPTTYNFTNVNYSGQTTRIQMMAEMDSVIKTANNGAALDSTMLQNMYAGSGFSRAALNGTGKQLKNKTISTAQAEFDRMLGKVAIASKSATAVASPGTAGISTSNDQRKYLVDENGVEWGQVISKGLMGGVFYNQAVDGYLTNAKIGNSVDNTTVKEGEGTAMEHHWDEAFGYFGAPVNFPENTTDTKYWANYSNQVNASINSNKTLMDAFLKGRAAISNKDMAAKEAAAATIRAEWEKLVAAALVHELNAARKNHSDVAKRSHYLSEAKGFALGLGYKTEGRKITTSQLNDVHTKLGVNFYNTTTADIAAVIDIISAAYSFDAVKDNL